MLPAVTIVAPITLGTRGPAGKSAYQQYLDTTSDDPVKTAEEWASSATGTDLAVVNFGDYAVLNIGGVSVHLATVTPDIPVTEPEQWASILSATGQEVTLVNNGNYATLTVGDLSINFAIVTPS